jgi:uncharacterized protein
LDAGADVNLVPSYGDTPLIVAIKSGNIEIFKAILGAGVDVNLAPSYGEPPLMAAIKSGNIEIFKAILDSGVDVKINSYSDTPLSLTLNYNPEMFYLLINAGADPKSDPSLLIPAIHGGHKELYKDLIAVATRLNYQNNINDTPAH